MVNSFVDSIINEIPSQKNTRSASSVESSSFVNDIINQIQTKEDTYTIQPKQPTEVEVDEKPTSATLGNNAVWLDAAKKIYEDEEGKSFDPDDAGYDTISDWFENRHSKYNWNVVNMLQTGFNVDEKSDDVKRAWLDSMNLYDESDTDVGDFFRAAKNFVFDPTTIASALATFGAGAVAKLGGQKAASLLAKATFKGNLRDQLKGKVSKETIEEIIKTKGSKDITAEALKTARNKAALKTMGYKGATTVPIGAAFMGAVDIAEQEMELGTLLPETVAAEEGISIEDAVKHIEQRKEEGYDLQRLGEVAALGGVLGLVLGPFPTYVGSKLGMRRAIKKSVEGARDSVDVKYAPKGNPHLTIRQKMSREQFNKLSQDDKIEMVGYKNITEAPKRVNKNPKINIEGEQIIERTLPDGTIVQTVRQRITEKLADIGGDRLANINTVLGRFFTSTAALPTALAKYARQRSNFSKAAELEIESSIANLKKLQKEEGFSTNALSKFLNENDSKLLVDETSQEILTKVDKINKDIYKNQEKINTLAGKKTDEELMREAEGLAAKSTQDSKEIFKKLREDENKIGVAYGEDGGYYFRTFEASYNPKYQKEIENVLNERGIPKSEFITKVENFKNYLRERPEFDKTKEGELDNIILGLVKRLSKDDTTVFDQPFKIIEDFLGTQAAKQKKAIVGTRKQLDAALLDLLGEVTDPYVKIKQTLAKQNRIIGELQYANDVNKFFQNILAKNSDVNLNLGGLVNALPTTQGQVSRIKGNIIEEKSLNDLYTDILGDKVKKKYTSKSENILKDIYINPEMSALITQGLDTVFPSSSKTSGGVGNAIWSGVQHAAAFGQSTQTILDYPAYFINGYGAVQNLIAGGYLFNKASWKGLRKSLQEMRKGIRDEDPEVLEYVRKLKRDGVIDSDLTSEMIIRNINQNNGTMAGGPFVQKYKKGMEKLSRAYGWPDTYAKLLAHKAETAALKKIHPTKSSDEIFDMASQKVIDTMPTYGAANPAARFLGRIPFGTYALFPTEMLRTTKNITKYAIKDIKEGVSTGNRAQMVHGMRKLVGLGATGAGIGAAVDTKNTSLGITEDDKRALDAAAPDWGKGGNPFFLEGIAEDSQGRIITRNIRSANFDAQDYLKVPLRLMTGKILAGEQVTDLEIDDAFKAMGSSILGPYTNTKFVYEALLNVVSGVDTETGRPIYSRFGEQEGFSVENVKRAILELGGSILPGSIEPLIKYAESAEAAQITKDGEGISKSGFPLRENDILTWMLSGIRPATIDVKKSIGYNLAKQIKDMAQSKKAFENYIRTMPTKDYSKPENMQDLLDKYTEYQDLKFRSSQRLSQKIDLFKKINYTDRSGKRRKFGLEQIIMAATNDGFYDREKDVEAIALADAELNNYSRGVFLPDDINSSNNFVKMLTDKGVPLTIFKQLADINQRYYKRMDEGLVKKAGGGSIMDRLLEMFNPISKLNVGEEKVLEDLRRARSQTTGELPPKDFTEAAVPTPIDLDTTVPVSSEKPPVPVSNKFNNFARAVAEAENNPLLKLLDSDPNKKLKDIDSGKSITATGKSDEIERGFGQTAKTLKEIQAIIGPDATVQDAYDQLQNRLRSKIDDISKTKNHRFKNIKNYPEEYQYILVSIADNIGIEGLNEYEKLQKAMDSKDNKKIKKEMVTVSSKEPEKYNKGLKNRANAIYDALFPTEGNK